MRRILIKLRAYLGHAAARVVRRERPIIVAITGTVGKSSTKQAIGALLSGDGVASSVRVSAKNYNNELGVPLTIFGASSPGRSVTAWLSLLFRAFFASIGWSNIGVKTFVLEMGADHPGDLAHLTSIAPPDISVITAVTLDDASLAPVHLSNYSSIDAVADEKATLARAVGRGGTVILNADDKRVFAMRHLTQGHVLTYGETDAANARIASTRVIGAEGEYGFTPKGLEIVIEYLNQRRTLYVPGTFGRLIAYAICAAMLVGEALDLPIETIGSLTSRLHLLPGRTRIIPGMNHSTIFDDSYNASPAAVLSALHDLAALPLRSSQRRIACLGEMRELGATAQTIHRMIGAEVAKSSVDLFIACGIFGAVMAEGAQANGMRSDQVLVFPDAPEAASFLESVVRPGDVILVKASEGQSNSVGARMERVVKRLMEDPTRAKELLCRQEASWERYL